MVRLKPLQLHCMLPGSSLASRQLALASIAVVLSVPLMRSQAPLDCGWYGLAIIMAALCDFLCQPMGRRESTIFLGREDEGGTEDERREERKGWSGRKNRNPRGTFLYYVKRQDKS